MPISIDKMLQMVLSDIWTDFYEPRSREFFRDKPALLRAISHYGVECVQRGWNPDPSFIAAEILYVLRSLKERKIHIKYLPVYLHTAISRLVGQRAEEIRANSSSMATITGKIIEGTTRVEAIRQPTTVEVLAKLYKSLEKPRCPKCHAKQRQLL